MKSAITLILMIFAPAALAGQSGFAAFDKHLKVVFEDESEVAQHSEEFKEYFEDISDMFKEEIEKIQKENSSIESGPIPTLAFATAAHSFINTHIAHIIINLCKKHDSKMRFIFMKKPELTNLYHFQDSSWRKLNESLHPIVWKAFGPNLGPVIRVNEDIFADLEYKTSLAIDKINDFRRSKAEKKSVIIQLTVLSVIVENPDLVKKYFRNSFLKGFSYLSNNHQDSNKHLQNLLNTINSFGADPTNALSIFNFLTNF